MRRCEPGPGEGSPGGGGRTSNKQLGPPSEQSNAASNQPATSSAPVHGLHPWLLNAAPVCVSMGTSEGMSPRAALTTPAAGELRVERVERVESAAGQLAWLHTSPACTGSCTMPHAAPQLPASARPGGPPFENWAWFMPGMMANGRTWAKCLQQGRSQHGRQRARECRLAHPP